MYRPLFLMVSLFAIDAGHADGFATTDLGKRVLLRADGTWQVAEAVGSGSEAFDFRRSTWGMTMSEVADSESLGSLTSGELVSGAIGGLTVHIGYLFSDDRLIGSICRLAERHTENTAFADDFGTLKDALIGQSVPVDLVPA